MSEHVYTLKELRARHNLSQREIAQIIGVTPKTYNLLENSYECLRSTKIETIYRLINYYGVKFEQIFLPVDVIKNNK